MLSFPSLWDLLLCVRYTDPVYLKVEKVDMMVRLCTPKNAEQVGADGRVRLVYWSRQVLSEFKEYAADVDIDFSRKAVSCGSDYGRSREHRGWS